MKRYCGQCDNFTGAGDWNLCCNNPPKKYNHFDYPCGFLVYAHTEADDCENFEPAVNKCEECKHNTVCKTQDTDKKCHKFYYGEWYDYLS